MSGDNSIHFDQVIRDGLNMVDSNYNTAFAANIGELLQYGSIGGQMWKPAIDLMEGTGSILLHIYIPGVDKDSLSIDFLSDYMILQGRRDYPNFTPLSANILVNRTQEIIYGSFERRIKLPITVTNKENVTLSISNGILIVNINKDAEIQHRFSITPVDITEE